MSRFSLSRVRELCDAKEFRVVASSRGTALETAGEAGLKKNMALARKFRDKWRDVFARQRRRSHKELGFRTTQGSLRSREKSELFEEVFARLEAQLNKRTAKPSVRKTARAKAKKTTGAAVRSAAKRTSAIPKRKARQAKKVKGRPRRGERAEQEAGKGTRFKSFGHFSRSSTHTSSRNRRSQARRDFKR